MEPVLIILSVVLAAANAASLKDREAMETPWIVGLWVGTAVIALIALFSDPWAFIPAILAIILTLRESALRSAAAKV